MNAFEELEAGGQLGPGCYALFLNRAGREVRRGGYPAPGAAASWSDTDIAEIVHELFARTGTALSLKLMEAATLDALERLITTIVKNFLVDTAKKSAAGKLRSRMNTLMTADTRFADLAGYRWALTHGPMHATEEDGSALEASAWQVAGVYLHTELNTAGRTSAANASSLLTVAHHVVCFADGSVRAADLTRAVGYRFALLPLFAPYQADLVRQVVGPAMDPVGSQLANSQAAAQLAAALDAAEREAVRHHAQGQSVTALAVALACSRRQATAVSERMKEKVRLATLGDDKPEETLRELLLLLTPSYGALEANSSSTESDMLTLEPVTSPAGGIDE